MFIFGRIKEYIIAALALAIPIIYVFGRLKGAETQKRKLLKEELKTQEKVSDFYKSVAEHETDTLTDRKSVTDRLRSNGL